MESEDALRRYKHNLLEIRRRKGLKEAFNSLQDVLSKHYHNMKHDKISIVKHAIQRIEELQNHVQSLAEVSEILCLD